MNHDPIKQTFDKLTPTSEQKSRMLSNILDQIDARSASSDTAEPTVAPVIPLKSKRTHTKQWLALAASIALVIGLSFSLQHAQPAPPQGMSPIDDQQQSPAPQTLELATLLEKMRIYEDVKALKIVASDDFEVIATLDAAQTTLLAQLLSTNEVLDPAMIDFEALNKAPFLIFNLEFIDGQQFQLFYTPSLGILDFMSQYYEVSEETAAHLQDLLP